MSIDVEGEMLLMYFYLLLMYVFTGINEYVLPLTQFSALADPVVFFFLGGGGLENQPTR